MKPRWFEQPRIDYVLVAAVTGVHGLFVWKSRGGGDILAWGGAEQRLQVYIVTATVAALLLTVGTSSLAIYVGGSGRRLREFRVDAGEHGLALILSVITALLLLSLVSVVGVMIDVKDESNAWVRWPFEASFLLTVWRGARATYLFSNQVHGDLYDALDADRADTSDRAAL